MRATPRKLSTAEILEVAGYIQDHREHLCDLRPTNDQLEEIIRTECGIDANGQGLRRLAKDAGVEIPTRRSKPSGKKARLEDVSDLRWAVSVMAEAVASLYLRFGERVPDGVQAVCNTLDDRLNGRNGS
jgi:hypothetical protein